MPTRTWSSAGRGTKLFLTREETPRPSGETPRQHISPFVSWCFYHSVFAMYCTIDMYEYAQISHNIPTVQSELQTPMYVYKIKGELLGQLGRLHRVVHPLHLRRRPDATDDFSIDQTHRYRSVVSRIPRPGKVIPAHIDMAFRHLHQRPSATYPNSKLPRTFPTLPGSSPGSSQPPY